jgi:hypothetical protein
VYISNVMCRGCFIVRCDEYTNVINVSMALARIIVWRSASNRLF